MDRFDVVFEDGGSDDGLHAGSRLLVAQRQGDRNHDAEAFRSGLDWGLVARYVVLLALSYFFVCIATSLTRLNAKGMGISFYRNKIAPQISGGRFFGYRRRPIGHRLDHRTIPAPTAAKIQSQSTTARSSWAQRPRISRRSKTPPDQQDFAVQQSGQWILRLRHCRLRHLHAEIPGNSVPAVGGPSQLPKR